MNVTLGPGLLEAIIEHAKAAYPVEGCGLLVGRQDTAERFVPMSNVLSSPSEYEMDPQQLVNQLRNLREAGEELVAIYHSHPSGTERPSKRDIERAYYPKAANVIVSLADPDHPRVGAYRIVAGEILEIELRAIV